MNIPRQCYKYKTGEEQIKSENIPFHEVEEIDYTSEILLYIKDCSYPWRGYTSDETMFATNQVKSLFIENIKILSKKQFILGTLYTFVNWFNFICYLHTKNIRV